MAETRGTQSSISLDAGPRQIQPLLPGPPTLPLGWAEGHLRPVRPPKAVQSSRKREADLGLVLVGESEAQRKKPRAYPQAWGAAHASQSQDVGSTWRQGRKE